MIEYLYDVIRATFGEEFEISANITDEDGVAITDKSYAVIFNENEEILLSVDGVYDGEGWIYSIPAIDGKGRYWYCVYDGNGNSLHFKKPLYLM